LTAGDRVEIFSVLPRRFGVEPLHLLAALVAAFLLLDTIGPLFDLDVYWHVRLANEVTDSGFAGAGRGWSFTVDNPEWRSTQWISELLMGAFHSAWGWSGLVVFRGLGTIALIAALAWTTLRGIPARAGVPAFALAGLTLSAGLQDRPLILGLLPIPFLALTWRTAVAEGRWPRWWLLVPATAVYANVHGLWVMVPGMLGLAVLGRWLDHGIRDQAALRGIALAAAATAVGAISPLGVANITAVFAFRDATTLISEWQPTTAAFGPTWIFAALAGLAIVAWARGPHVRPPRSEVLLILVLLAFASTALRNLVPAALLLAPIVARRCTEAWDVRPYPTGRRESRVLVAVSATILVACGAVAGTTWWVGDPLPDKLPFGIAERLDARDRPLRLFNEYNVAGAVLGFTDQVTLGVDGRADYYGGTYISDYLDIIAAKPGSFRRFLRADPDAALLAKTAPLTDVLKGRGWTVTDREGKWVLLEPPPG
jgi:hypothetical protein